MEVVEGVRSGFPQDMEWRFVWKSKKEKLDWKGYDGRKLLVNKNHMT